MHTPLRAQARTLSLTTHRRALIFLTERAFPVITTYATHPYHIAAMAALWVVLLLAGSFTAFELVGGNYANGLSALLSCVLVYQQLRHHREVKQMHAESARRDEAQRAELARVHARLDAAESAAMASQDTQPLSVVQPVTRPTLVPTEPRPGAKSRAGRSSAKSAKPAPRRRSRGFDPVDPIDEEE
jgi:hypothetical protein